MMEVTLVAKKKNLIFLCNKKPLDHKLTNSFLCLVDELCEQWSNTNNVITQEC